MLSDFYEGETKKFTVNISYKGTTPDISGDTVKFLLKKQKTDLDQNAKIDKNGDVDTNGVNGQALFNLEPTDTAIEPGTYYYELIWTLASGEIYILESGKVNILDRIKDV